jgi:acetyl esterase
MDEKLFDDIEHTARKFLETLNASPGPQLYEMSVEQARAFLKNAQAATPVPLRPMDIEELTFSSHVGPVSLRIVRPQGSNGVLPAILYCHGGGWILGDASTHDYLVREIAHGTGAAVIFVNYTPSPEAHYPLPIEQAYAALEYCAQSSTQLRIDPSRIAIAGDSVGGNMTAAVTLMTAERKGPSLVYQVLFYPVTDAGFDTESYKKFATGFYLTAKAMYWFWDAYAPDVKVRSNPTASPLRASLEQLKQVPPALIIVDEFDVLRDEGEAYAYKLIKAGIKVTPIRMLGITHDFVMLHALAKTPQAHAAIELAIMKLKKAFSR